MRQPANRMVGSDLIFNTATPFTGSHILGAMALNF